LFYVQNETYINIDVRDYDGSELYEVIDTLSQKKNIQPGSNIANARPSIVSFNQSVR